MLPLGTRVPRKILVESIFSLLGFLYYSYYNAGEISKIPLLGTYVPALSRSWGISTLFPLFGALCSCESCVKKKVGASCRSRGLHQPCQASRLLDSRLFPTWFTPSSPPFQKKKVVGSRSLSGCLAAKHPFSTANADVYCARESAAQPVLVAGQTATPAALSRRV